MATTIPAVLAAFVLSHETVAVPTVTRNGSLPGKAPKSSKPAPKAQDKTTATVVATTTTTATTATKPEDRDHAGFLRGLNRARTTAEEIALVKDYMGVYDSRPHGVQLETARQAARLGMKPVKASTTPYARGVAPTVAGYVAGMPQHGKSVNLRDREAGWTAVLLDIAKGRGGTMADASVALYELTHARMVEGNPMSLKDQEEFLAQCGWPEVEVDRLFAYLDNLSK